MTTSPIDWVDLYTSADLIDPATLKSQLDLVAVCEAIGIVLEEDRNGKWHGLCPFHDDTNPSLDVYVADTGTQRVGCMACDFGNSNDVFDLLKRLRGYGFREALAEARELLATCRSGTRSTLERPRRPDVDLTRFSADAAARADAHPEVFTHLLHERGINVPIAWLRAEFGVGVTPDGDGVVVPHYDRAGTCVAAKIRRAHVDGWKPIAVAGSRLQHLYGAWRDQGRDQVLLVEGESDTWTMAYLLRDRDWDVLGLPSGAAARPWAEAVEALADRTVTLMFDADRSGRHALTNWQERLGVVRVAQLDEGHDPTSEDRARVLAALDAAQKVGTALSAGLVEAPFGGYLRRGDQAGVHVTDFTLRLVRTIAIEDEGYAFDVALPDGRIVPLARSDLANDANLNKWANQWGYTAVNATIRDARELQRMLFADGAFHPRVRGTRYAGLIERTFVLPHETIGGKSWAYVAPEGDAKLARKLSLAPGRWDSALPVALANLHLPEVMTPLLGWIAAAPLRSTVPSFPFLALVGVHGTGKSTLMRETLATFGYEIHVDLSSTTAYAVEVLFGCTNAFPVWFDEYRHGTRTDGKERFNQLLRSAWDASESQKGGLGENKQALTDTVARAPICVSGEDAFSEGSHLERAVLVNLPMHGRNAKALDYLLHADRVGFGRAYLEWLVFGLTHGSIQRPPRVHSRPEHARAVATWGYELFTRFSREVCGMDVPEFNGELIRHPHTQVLEKPILLEAIGACLSRHTHNGPVVWRDGDDLCVRHHDLVRECHLLKIQLPGNARAVEEEIRQRWDAVDDESAMLGKFIRIRGGVAGL